MSRELLYWEKYAKEFMTRDTLSTTIPERVKGGFQAATVCTLFKHFRERLKDATILDYGCGTGRLAASLVGRCRKLILMDISLGEILACKKRFGERDDVEYIHHMAEENLPFADQSIDFTYSYACLVYAPDEEHFFRYYREIDRVSRSFALHMHRGYNLSPNPERSIANGCSIFDGEFYRPTPEIVLERFPGENYLVEFAQPDVRGVEPFFYKLPPSSAPDRALGR